MAVPASGVLTMLGIAQERLYGTYGTGTITGSIVTTDLISGGNAGGSGNSYPALNTSSPSKPNTSTPHSMNEWYSYDQDYSATTEFYLTISISKGTLACESSPETQSWHNGSSALAAVGDTVYTNSGGTTTKASGTYGESEDYGGEVFYRIVVNSSGVVTARYVCIF